MIFRTIESSYFRLTNLILFNQIAFEFVLIALITVTEKR